MNNYSALSALLLRLIILLVIVCGLIVAWTIFAAVAVAVVMFWLAQRAYAYFTGRPTSSVRFSDAFVKCMRRGFGGWKRPPKPKNTGDQNTASSNKSSRNNKDVIDVQAREVSRSSK